MVSLAEICGKLDTTKIRVTEGDLPAGDWIFNGTAMVLPPKDPKTGKDLKDPATPEEEVEKVIVPLKGKVKITPVKAEEFGVLRQFASDKLPLAGALAGAMTPFGFAGLMTGFAAGSFFGRNICTFQAELEDGRRFLGLADYKVFQRLMACTKN